jgi:anti-anti-sigma factor
MRAQAFHADLGGVKDHTLLPLRPLRVNSSRDGTWAVLTVAGELNVTTVRTFQAELDRVFSDDDGPTGLLVGTADLTFTDSSGIRATVLAAQRVHGRFGLVRVPDKLQKLISMKGLGIVLRSFPDLDSAKAALA